MTCTTHHDACECREAAHAAEIARLTAEVHRLRENAERWSYCVTHCFPVVGQDGKWYVDSKRDFHGYATATETIDAARSKP